MFSIAIDGPAGAGKSSVAKAAAAELKFIYVDTGALYRAVALQLINCNTDVDNQEAVKESLAGIEVTMQHMDDGQHVFLCGADVNDKIRTPQVSMMTSKSSALPTVRNLLFKLQTEMAEKYNVIMDGRDIGTVVLPRAQVKIFLTASPEIRAKRRCDELEQKGESVDYNETLADIIKRDYQDSHREIAPLKPAEDSVLLDTSGMNFLQVVEALVNIVHKKAGELNAKI